MSAEPKLDALEHAARAHFLLIGLSAILFALSLSMWPDTRTYLEMEELDLLISDIERRSQHVLKTYRASWFYSYSDSIEESISKALGTRVFYKEQWVREKTAGALLSVRPSSPLPSVSTMSIGELGDFLETTEIFRIKKISQTSAVCESERHLSKSMFITNLIRERLKENVYAAEFSLGRRVGRPGEPLEVVGSLHCQWQIEDQPGTALESGAFSGRFPALVGMFADVKLSQARQRVSEMREESFRETVEYLGINISRKYSAWGGWILILLTQVYILAFLKIAVPVPDSHRAVWIGGVRNTWGLLFNLATLVLIPALVIIVSFFLTTRFNLTLSAFLTTPHGGFGLYIVLSARS